MTTEEIWKHVLGELELHISRPNFLTWLKQSHLVTKDDKNGAVLVSLPNSFAKDWVQGRYHKLILGSLRNLDGSIKTIEYTVTHGSEKQSLLHKLKKKHAEEDPPPQQETLLDLKVDPSTNLNPRYTLDSFIVGSSNELAYAASQAIIGTVGTKYNPLFIYGGVGLGKTHLVQATGNEILKQYQKKIMVLYVAAEKYLADVVWAIKNKRMEDIKHKYRSVDVLVVDDIQLISGKAATEQEFFYTFNALYEHNKQIIITSDRPPAAIANLEERLRSRFEGGMIVDVGYPDYETRLAILKLRSQSQGTQLADWILQTIAERVRNNIRELEGVFNKVVFYENYKKEATTDRRLDTIIQEVTRVTPKNIAVQDIVKTVSDFFGVLPEELTRRSRKQEVVLPRQVCMYLMRELLNMSYPHIGEKMGKRDHTTAIHACEKVARVVNQDPQFNQKILMVKDRLVKH